MIRGRPVRDDGTYGGWRKYWPKVSYLQALPTEELERATTDPEDTVVVDVPVEPASNRLPTEVAEDTLTDHGEGTGPHKIYTLDELNEQVEIMEEKERGVDLDERKQAIIDAIAKKRPVTEDEEDDDDDFDTKEWN